MNVLNEIDFFYENKKILTKHMLFDHTFKVIFPNELLKMLRDHEFQRVERDFSYNLVFFSCSVLNIQIHGFNMLIHIFLRIKY